MQQRVWLLYNNYFCVANGARLRTHICSFREERMASITQVPTSSEQNKLDATDDGYERQDDVLSSSARGVAHQVATVPITGLWRPRARWIRDTP